MNNPIEIRIVDRVTKSIYVIVALIFLNYLALVYDAEWLQIAIIIDISLIVSFTGITLVSKLPGNNS